MCADSTVNPPASELRVKIWDLLYMEGAMPTWHIAAKLKETIPAIVDAVEHEWFGRTREDEVKIAMMRRRIGQRRAV